MINQFHHTNFELKFLFCFLYTTSTKQEIVQAKKFHCSFFVKKSKQINYLQTQFHIYVNSHTISISLVCMQCTRPGKQKSYHIPNVFDFHKPVLDAKDSYWSVGGVSEDTAVDTFARLNLSSVSSGKTMQQTVGHPV